MATFQQSEHLQQLVAALDEEELSAKADGTCTTGYDNDGSTGYSLFKTGFELAQKAQGKPVFVVFCDEIALFFIGTEDEVAARIGPN